MWPECGLASGRAHWRPGVWAVRRQTLHGGSVLLRPVKAAPCLNYLYYFWVFNYTVCIVGFVAQRSVILPQWMICRQAHPTSFRRPPPNIHHYVTKKRRFLADLKRRMEWAERLLRDEEERKQNALENAGKETEPHMLHVVYLLKPLKGRPWWEKKIAEELQIEEVWCILSGGDYN